MATPAIPAFEISLTDDDAARLGRIIVMWSHAEAVVDHLIMLFTPIDLQAYRKLCGGMMIKGKVEVLAALAPDTRNLRTMSAVDFLCKAIHNSVADRNDAVHGVWGVNETGESEAASGKRIEPFTLTKLKRLELASINITRKAVAALTAVESTVDLPRDHQIRIEIPPHEEPPRQDRAPQLWQNRNWGHSPPIKWRPPRASRK